MASVEGQRVRAVLRVVVLSVLSRAGLCSAMLVAVGFAWVVAALSSQSSPSSSVTPTAVSVSVRTVASVSVTPASAPGVGHALTVGAAPGGGGKPSTPKSSASKPSGGSSGGGKAKPAATKPAATKPAATKPAATKPAATKPAGATQGAKVGSSLAATQPVATHPAGKTPQANGQHPATGQPATAATRSDTAQTTAANNGHPATNTPAVNGQPGKSAKGTQPADTSTAKTGPVKKPDTPANQGAVTGHPTVDQHAPVSGTPVVNGQTTPKRPTVGTPQGSPPPVIGGRSIAPNSVSDTSAPGLRLAPDVGPAYALAGVGRQNSDGSYSLAGPGNSPAPLVPGLPAPDHTPPAVPPPSTPGPTGQTRTTTSGSGGPAPTTNPFLAIDNALTMPGADPNKLRTLDDAIQGAPQPVPSPNTGPDPPPLSQPKPPLSQTDPYLVNQVHNPSTAANQPQGQPAPALVAAPTAGVLARAEAGLEGLGETVLGLGEGATGVGAEIAGVPADGTGVGAPAGVGLALGGLALFDFAGDQFVNGWHNFGRAFSSTAPAAPATPKPATTPTLPSPQIAPGPGTDPAPTGSPQTAPAPHSPLIPNYDPLHPPNPFDPNNPFNPNTTPQHSTPSGSPIPGGSPWTPHQPDAPLTPLNPNTGLPEPGHVHAPNDPSDPTPQRHNPLGPLNPLAHPNPQNTPDHGHDAPTQQPRPETPNAHDNSTPHSDHSEESEGGKELRPRGSELDSVEDVMANPYLLKGKTPAQVESILRGSSSGWEFGSMRKSRHGSGTGWTMRERNARGTDYTDRYIQWHPGSSRHYGGRPYWKVSSGRLGTVRFEQ